MRSSPGIKDFQQLWSRSGDNKEEIRLSRIPCPFSQQCDHPIQRRQHRAHYPKTIVRRRRWAPIVPNEDSVLPKEWTSGQKIPIQTGTFMPSGKVHDHLEDNENQNVFSAERQDHSQMLRRVSRGLFLRWRLHWRNEKMRTRPIRGAWWPSRIFWTIQTFAVRKREIRHHPQIYLDNTYPSVTISFKT